MKEIEDLISENLKNQFRCRAAGSDAGEFIAITESVPANGAIEADLKLLVDCLKEHSKEFHDFYSEYDGIVFHQDLISGEAGLEIHPVKNWGNVTLMMKEWYDLVDEDELEEAGVDWLESAIAFAEAPSSGNYFVIALEGEKAGKILFADHDGLESDVYANSFFEFLKKYLDAPAKEMYNMGCTTRYSDGKTNIQWIPEESYSP